MLRLAAANKATCHFVDRVDPITQDMVGMGLLLAVSHQVICLEIEGEDRDAFLTASGLNVPIMDSAIEATKRHLPKRKPRDERFQA